MLIEIIDLRTVGLFARCRDQPLLGAVFQVPGGLIAGGEQPGAFIGDIYIARRQVFRIANGDDPDAVVANEKPVAINKHLLVQSAIHAVDFQQMGHSFRRSQVINGDDVGVLGVLFQKCAQYVRTR